MKDGGERPIRPPAWAHLGRLIPDVATTIRSCFDQLDVVLRPGSGGGGPVDTLPALRAFTIYVESRIPDADRHRHSHRTPDDPFFDRLDGPRGRL